MSSVVAQSRIGSVVGGRYRLLATLGRGGMGVLYCAEHLLTGRRVALKLLRQDVDADEAQLTQLRARFFVEARAAAAVSHHNIVDVLDMGTDDDGSPFLALELLAGSPLDRALIERGRLSFEDTLNVALPIIGALAKLHDAGIVHRDIKPSNIFLCEGARGAFEPKLLDFGLAHTLSDLRLTRSGLVMGTPLYMAPEHAAGEMVGPQADVWSLGVVLFECLAGRLPFNTREPAAVAAQVMAGRVLSIQSVAPSVPPPLAFAVDRALRRDLALRYANMRDFAKALVVAAVGSGIPLPHDPDPVGLPDVQSWVRSASSADGTMSTPVLVVPSLAETPNDDRARQLASTPPAPVPTPPSPRTALARVLVRGGMVVVFVLAIAGLGALWRSKAAPALNPDAAPPLGTSERETPSLSRPAITTVAPSSSPPSPAPPSAMPIQPESERAPLPAPASAKTEVRLQAGAPVSRKRAPKVRPRASERVSAPIDQAAPEPVAPTPPASPAPSREDGSPLGIESDWR